MNGQQQAEESALEYRVIRRWILGPCLAETLRRAVVSRNIWTLPACHSVYLTNDGPVVTVGAAPLSPGTTGVPAFDHDALIALRSDQGANSTLPEFLAASWKAGILRDDVDFNARTVTYLGLNAEEYVEGYPAVEIP